MKKGRELNVEEFRGGSGRESCVDLSGFKIFRLWHSFIACIWEFQYLHEFPHITNFDFESVWTLISRFLHFFRHHYYYENIRRRDRKILLIEVKVLVLVYFLLLMLHWGWFSESVWIYNICLMLLMKQIATYVESSNEVFIHNTVYFGNSNLLRVQISFNCLQFLC